MRRPPTWTETGPWTSSPWIRTASSRWRRRPWPFLGEGSRRVPFDPVIDTLSAGELLYRVLSATREAAEFNPGLGAPTRFGFFGDPVVPIMYAAQTEDAAIAERCSTTSRPKAACSLTTGTPARCLFGWS